jgi:PST family polysaccharide transporter
MGQGAVAFLSQNTDYLAVGRVLGATQLGFYSMAYRLAELPYLGIADPIARVTFPAFARMRQRGEDIRPAFLSGLRLVALAACPIGVLLSATAAPFTQAILGDRWLPMIGPLAVLGIWGAVYPIQWTFGWLLNSLGLQGLVARISFTVLVVTAPALFAAAKLGGLTAVAWTMLASLAISLVPMMTFASRRGRIPLATQLRALGPVLAAVAVSWGAARIVADAMAGSGAGLALGTAALAGIAAYAGSLFIVAPDLIRVALEQGSRAVHPKPPVAPEAS